MTQHNSDSFADAPWRLLSPEHHPLTLCPSDAAALDALLDQQSGTPAAGPVAAPAAAPAAAPIAADPQRLARISAWLDVLAAAPAAAPSTDLLQKTLAAVTAAAAADRRAAVAAASTAPIAAAAASSAPHHHRARPAEAQPSRSRATQRFGELATMAVAAGLTLAILIPGLGYVRQTAQRTACAGNLMALGAAFGTYAANYSDQLPALPPGPDHNWLGHASADSGSTADSPSGASIAQAAHSNTANLLPLVRLGYVSEQRLVDPAQGRQMAFNAEARDLPDSACSYSYLNMPSTLRPQWNRTRRISVLADRNPLFAAPAAHDPSANSFNHGGAGNNILVSDGSVFWSQNPDVGPDNDNIWTIGNQTRYVGVEMPEAPTDVFLAP